LQGHCNLIRVVFLNYRLATYNICCSIRFGNAGRLFLFGAVAIYIHKHASVKKHSKKISRISKAYKVVLTSSLQLK